MPDLHSVLMVAVISAVTVLLRFLPFIIFRKRETPKFIAYLGRVLPYAIMGMLVVYCLRKVAPMSYPYGAPELISITVITAVHVWRRNTLLSILSGTVLYMILVQLVF